MDRTLFILLLLILVLPVTFAEMTPEDRVYIDSQLQKFSAQLSSKMDSQTNRVQEEMKTQFDTARTQLQDDMSSTFKGSLKAIAVGLGGMIVVVLALFKMIDLKLNHTRRIQKYEKELEVKTKELDALILSNKKYREELDGYRDQLLKAVREQSGQAPLEMKPSQDKKKPTFNVARTFFKVLFIIIAIAVLIFVAYKLGLLNFLTPKTVTTLTGANI